MEALAFTIPSGRRHLLVVLFFTWIYGFFGHSTNSILVIDDTTYCPLFTPPACGNWTHAPLCTPLCVSNGCCTLFLRANATQFTPSTCANAMLFLGVQHPPLAIRNQWLIPFSRPRANATIRLILFYQPRAFQAPRLH